MQPNRRIPGIYPVIIKHGGDTALKTVWETPKRTVKNKEVRHTRKTVEGNKEMIKKFMLQIFADEGGEGNNGGNEGNSGANIDYEKLAQIIAGKQTATEDSVIRGYLKQQGLSKEEMNKAVEAFKAEKAKNDPAKKLEEMQAKINQYENEKVLAKHNVRKDDYDYVLFKASQNTDDKTSFDKAVENFLKENPRFVNGKGSYKVDTGAKNTGAHRSENKNAEFNEIIRRRFGRS